MAKTLAEAFSTLHTWLTPSTTETTAAKSHRASIEQCLDVNFSKQNFFRTGSFGNGTSVSGYSDVDYFVSIPRTKLKQDSNLTLKEIKDVLDKRFPYTGVHIDGPAITLPFGSSKSESTEVVPADYTKQVEGKNVYEISDSYGGWQISAPMLHKAYIDNIDTKMSGKVKPLIRFVKAWKYYNNIPISSFYLEMYVGMYAYEEYNAGRGIIYTADLNIIFQRLERQSVSVITDPKGVSGSISAYGTSAEYQKIMTELANVTRRVKNARNAEEEGRIKDAFYWWNVVYDGLFPGYY